MMDDLQVRADLVFGDGEHSLDDLKGLYRESLRQLEEACRARDAYAADNDILRWENKSLSADVQKLKLYRDMLLTRLAEKRGGPGA